MNKFIIMIIISFILLSVAPVLGDNAVFDDVNHNEYNIYNVTNITSAYIYEDGNRVLTNSSISIINVSEANQTTFWSSLISYIPRWFWNNNSMLDLNETLLNSSIDNRIVASNTSIKAYVDTRFTNNNQTLIALDESTNTSMSAYADAQDTIYNESAKVYGDNTFINKTEEGNLNVNHSDSTTSWASVSGFVTRWFSDIANVLTFNETLLNSTIDDKINSHNQTLNSTYVTELELLDNNNSVISYINSQDTIYNSSMKTYVDAWNIIYNSSMVVYTNEKILDNNESVIAYINSQDILYNSSMKEYVDYEILTNNDSVVTYIGMVAYDTITNYSDTQFSNMTAEYITGGRLSINNTAQLYGNTFIKDIEGNTHHMNVDLENLDELNANVFFTPLHIETVYNESGYFANITTEQNEPSITVNIANSSGANNYRLQYNNITIQLNNGTNETPVLNRVYVYLDSGVPTWGVSTSKPTFKHALAANILVGDTGKIYAASLVEDSQNGFVKRTQRTLRTKGLTYESGFDFTASASDLDIGIGNFINSIYDQNISFNSTISTDGFYEVNISGDYVMLDGFSDIEQYSDGNPIGVNKYFNVVFGITPYDGYANIYAVIQKKPIVEYTSVIRAYADSSNTLTVYPDDTFLRISFLPIARMIIQQGDEAQILPNTLYAEDYRGGIAGGVSSGGGIAEADPLSIHKDGSIELTSSWDVGAYDILANSFNGSWNGSSLYYLSSEVDTEILNNNDTIISYIIAQILNNNNTLNSSYVTTLEQLSNNLSLEAYIDAQDGIYNVSSALYTNEQILENNASVLAYVVALDSATNTSMKAYVDGLPAGFTNGSSIEVFNINSTGLIYGNGSQLTNLPTGSGFTNGSDIFVNKILVNNGSNSAPSYGYNSGDGKVFGMYLTSDEGLGFSIDGNERVKFLSGSATFSQNAIYIPDSLVHDTDADTLVSFSTDRIYNKVGNQIMLDLTESTTDTVVLRGQGKTFLTCTGTGGTDSACVINSGGSEVSFKVRSNTDLNALYVSSTAADGSPDGYVGIGTATPDSKLKVVGNVNVSNYNVTVNCIVFDSGGQICSGS